MTKIFIDGSAGTTGLRIRERLSARADIELLQIPDALRKDPAAVKEYINNSDITFLCLPDAAAKEAVTYLENDRTVIIDTSTAHRTADGWVYGMPELTGQRERIQKARLIANPGCHASGFIALVAPLTQVGVIGKDAKLSCFSLTGYSGGGKKMIADYESADRSPLLSAPRMYALPQAHKHLAEMAKVCGLEHAPVFCPVVADFYSGMQVTVTLTKDDINASVEDSKAIYRDYYREGLIRFADGDEEGFLSAGVYSGYDDMTVGVYGNDERITLVSRFDNLGKGASGAAIQNMNIVIGADEAEGLILCNQ